ncbi:MAG: hypothetical protein GVY31_02705 [Alphaproteobacteria bacterium]|jgi:prolyl 4-hydroxylase|nr:hypothetical protein [Alphaproteobacteria bacterium]
MQSSFLCANPLVCVLDDVFDDATAKAIISAGQHSQTRAKVQGAYGNREHDGRTNTQALIDQWSLPEAREVCERISDIVRLPPEHCETAKILRYEGDQKFDLHSDAYDDIMPGSIEALQAGGQRLFTTLCYLNAPEGGGETEFPKLKLSVQPRPGRVLLFSNTIPGTNAPHPHALHAGRSITGGVKWVMSLWWRERLYHVPRDYPEESGEMRRV